MKLFWGGVFALMLCLLSITPVFAEIANETGNNTLLPETDPQNSTIFPAASVDIRPEYFVNPPTTLTAGTSTSLTVRLKNYGDMQGTRNVEVAILPTTWDTVSASSGYSPESSSDIAQCCPANKYFDARSVTLAAGASEDVTFTVTAPINTTIDGCDTTPPARSAWGSSFKYRAAVFDFCGGSYSTYRDETGLTICTYSPTCEYTDADDCLDSNTVTNWDQYTLCDGGCSELKSTTYDCPSGAYCYDPGDAECRACPTTCDGICQSPACNDYDPDCSGKCYADIRAESFVNPSMSVSSGSSTALTVRFKNYGGISGTRSVEAAILPTTWDTSSATQNYAPESSVDIAQCCPENTYFDARNVTLAAGSSEDVSFTITAPTTTSVDYCSKTAPKRSAWGSSFKYRAAVFNFCGGSYSNHTDLSGLEICTYDPECLPSSYTDDDNCIGNKQVQDRYKDTKCTGGCSDWKNGAITDCASNQYCYEPYSSIDAECRACSTVCDETCQSAGCYGIDPDCKADGWLKSCSDTSGGGGGSISCSGRIVSEVKDSKGNYIPGARIYLDGAFTGTTDSFGQITSSTTDTYCGASHEITVYCSDGTYCSKRSTVINANDDIDFLSFNCQVCKPLPALSIGVTAASSYKINDVISLEITARDNSSAPAVNANVKICDPFLEASFAWPSCSYGYTDSNGKTYYLAKATKAGAYKFQISATKDGYVSASTEKTVTVGSFTGKITVDVDDMSGRPIANASVSLDGAPKGTTNSYGTLAFDAASAGTHSVKVNCPSGKLCGTKSADVRGDTRVDFGCDCTIPAGDLRVDVDTLEGYPVGNVYVFLDGEQNTTKLTGGFGSYYIAGLAQGNHQVLIAYNASNDSTTYNVYAQTKTVNIGSGTNVAQFVATTETDHKQNAVTNGTGTQFIQIPAIIAAGAIVLKVIFIADDINDVNEFCKCVFKEDSGKYGACTEAVNNCKNDILSCAKNVRADAVGGVITRASSECKYQTAFLAFNILPIDKVAGLAILSVKELKTVDKVSEGTRVSFKNAEGPYKYTKNTLDAPVTYSYKNGVKYIVEGTEHWAPEALDGIELIAKKGGNDAADAFVTVLKNEYAEEYAKKTATGIKALKDKNIEGIDGVIKRIVDSKGNVGNILGAATEVEGAISSEFAGKTLKAISKKDPGMETDFDLVFEKEIVGLDDELVEIKHSMGQTNIDAQVLVKDKLRKMEATKTLYPKYRDYDIIFRYKTEITDPVEKLDFEEYMRMLVRDGRIKSFGPLQ